MGNNTVLLQNNDTLILNDTAFGPSNAVEQHNVDPTAHPYILNLVEQKVSKSGDTMTGDLVLSGGAGVETEHGKIHEVNDNLVIGSKTDNYGLYIAPDGTGAAFISENGLNDVLTGNDLRNTYDGSSTYPITGQGVAAAISTKQNTITGAASTITTNNLSADKVVIANANGKVSTSPVTTTELGYLSGVTSSVQTQISSEIANRKNADNNLQNQITIIDGKIPAQASSTNQLADKEFVNSAVSSLAPSYITSNAQGEPFATKAALLAGPYYSNGEIHTLVRNDYAFVSADETHDNKSSSFLYDGTQWVWQYAISSTTLIAGDNIDITDNTISVTGVYTPNNLVAGQDISIAFRTATGYMLTATAGTYAYTSQTFNLGAATSWSYNTRYTYKVAGQAGGQWLFGNSNGYYTGPMLFIASNNRLGTYLSSNGTSFNIAQEVFMNSLTFQVDRTYDITLWYSNTEGYNFRVTDLTDNSTYTYVVSSNTAHINNTAPTYLMNNMGGVNNSYNQGIMYLANTTIVVDGVTVFNGATAEIGTDLINSGLTITGNPGDGYYEISSTVDTSTLQPKTLSTAIVVEGTSQTTVEGALGAVNTLAAKGLQSIPYATSSVKGGLRQSFDNATATLTLSFED